MSRGYINVTAVGTLGRDPEVRSTGNGAKVATFSIAVNQGYGERVQTEWVNILCFNKQAELAEKYLKKGKNVALSGTLQTSSWPDKETGQKRYKTEVVARDIVFMDGGGASSGVDEERGQERPQSAPVTRQQTASKPRHSGYESDAWGSEASDCDIPF